MANEEPAGDAIFRMQAERIREARLTSTSNPTAPPTSSGSTMGLIVGGMAVVIFVFFVMVKELGSILPMWLLSLIALGAATGAAKYGASRSRRWYGTGPKMTYAVAAFLFLLVGILLFNFFYEFDGLGYRTFLLFTLPLSVVTVIIFSHQAWFPSGYVVPTALFLGLITLISYWAFAQQPRLAVWRQLHQPPEKIRAEIIDTLQHGPSFTGTFGNARTAIKAELHYDPATGHVSGWIDNPDDHVHGREVMEGEIENGNPLPALMLYDAVAATRRTAKSHPATMPAAIDAENPGFTVFLEPLPSGSRMSLDGSINNPIPNGVHYADLVLAPAQ